MLKKLLFIPTFFLSTIFAQEAVEYFPAKLNVRPFAANQLEPKMGFLFDVGDNKVRLDVGNSIDIFHKKLGETETLSFGGDFFTYSLLRRQKDFKFPVEAIDYLFGLNAAYTNICNHYNYGLRFRLSHISAHLVDGSYSINKNEWRDNRFPFVYSREFIEFTPFIQTDNFRLYSTITLIYHVKPNGLGKDSYQIGAEYFMPELLSKNMHFYIGSDIKLIHLVDYNLNFSFQTGIQFGNQYMKGISIYFEYFSGKNIHGELFNENISKSAIGVNFDF